MKEIPKSSRFKRSTNVLYKLIAIYYENKRYARYPRFKVFRETYGYFYKLEEAGWQDEKTKKIIYLADTEIKYRDEAIDEVIKAIFEELVMNLDQGSIRYIEIKDGEKVLYTESNDKPYND